MELPPPTGGRAYRPAGGLGGSEWISPIKQLEVIIDTMPALVWSERPD